MSDLTLKRVDAAIDGEVVRHEWPTNPNAWVAAAEKMNRAIFLAGMRAAATIGKGYAYDADFHIRAAVKRLKKEMRDAK
jgi:hypothetical protein